jgi:two-component system C4-dicarboxylate transport sensor histidine kinase DctB
VEISAHRHGDSIEITVADTGSGIPDQLMDKIFDPFLTTKPPGKGTGLGLYVSRQLVEAAGGTINAANRPTGGTCFTVRFSVGK